ncbi:hypothetical protein TNCV_2766671 [Trichonephila clavipes]|nr:hypothetical protein TNCV_2766671 [Trichonephila clavipes]
MACDAEYCGFQMLNDDEIVTSMQEEFDSVDDETDEDEDINNESSKGPSNADPSGGSPSLGEYGCHNPEITDFHKCLEQYSQIWLLRHKISHSLTHPSNADAFSALETVLEWYKHQSRVLSYSTIACSKESDLAAKKTKLATDNNGDVWPLASEVRTMHITVNTVLKNCDVLPPGRRHDFKNVIERTSQFPLLSDFCTSIDSTRLRGTSKTCENLYQSPGELALQTALQQLQNVTS